MAVSLSELISQKATLERQIREAQAASKAEAIGRVRQLMDEHGLTAADIASAPGRRKGTHSGKKVAAKYRDPVSGATWSGRGLKPKWLATAMQTGKSLADFAV